jgi:copper chaperone CopZ
MTVTTVKIKGMTCGHCEGRVNTELGKLAGVTEVKASADAAEALITSSSELDSEQVAAAVIAAGYRVIS